MVSALDLARKLGGRLRHLAIDRVYGPYQRRRWQRQTGPARLLGRQLATDPEVLHPVYFRSTRALVDRVATLDLAGKRFLDMGCGSGAAGVFAGAGGARVTACDINPKAVALARRNFEANGIAGEVLQSDLFGALAGRAFDLIAFNIPFYARAPRTPFEAALYGGPELETVAAFARGCPGALAPGGRVLLVFSEQARRERILALCAAGGLVAVDEVVVRRMFERFHLITFAAAEPGEAGEATEAGRPRDHDRS